MYGKCIYVCTNTQEKGRELQVMKRVFDCCVHYWSWKIVKSQHGESDGRDSPTVRTPDRHCLIKDNLWCYHPKTFEMAKGKKGGAPGSLTQSQGVWLKPPALWHWATTPTDKHSSFFPFNYFAPGDDEMCVWLLCALSFRTAHVATISSMVYCSRMTWALDHVYLGNSVSLD